MKTYQLTVSEPEMRLIHYLLDEAALSLRKRLEDAVREADRPRMQARVGSGVALKSIAHPKTVRRKIKLAQAVQRLADNPAHVSVATALDHWTNKSGGKHGWDRWLKTSHPSSAALLWPA